MTITDAITQADIAAVDSGFWGQGGPAPIQKSATPTPIKCAVKLLHCAMFVLVSSLCHFVLHFLTLIIEFDFVLMTSAFSR